MLVIAFLLIGCGGSSDHHYYYKAPSDADIGDPAYYPGDYGIDDGIVIINESSPPIISIVINGVEFTDLFIKNNEYFAVESETIVGMSYFVEITYVNRKSCMVHWNPIYIGPQLIITRFPECQ